MRLATWAIALVTAALALCGSVAWAASARTLTVGPEGEFASLAEALEAARDGDTVLVEGGIYPGPVEVAKPVALVGRGWPEITGAGQGTVVRITAPGASITGFRVTSSGRSLDREDAGIWVEAADVTVAHNDVSDVLFGIVAKHAQNVVIQGNRVEAKRDLPEGEVGDGIRIWYSHGAQVLNNEVGYFRDCLVDSTEHAVIRGNVVHHGLIGVHVMRTWDVIVEENRLYENSVGLYLMFGTGAVARRNIATDNGGPSGYGIGLKDMNDTRLEENWIARNRVGIYFDNSPMYPDVPNYITGNVILNNETGMLFTPVTNGNFIGQNDLIDNFTQVGLAGGGSPGKNHWTPDGQGNFWSDYSGYDADADGVGDWPHREEGLFERLMDQEPKLRWFRFTPAASAVDFAARAFPAVAPQPLLVDEAPQMAPRLQAPLPDAPDQSGGLIGVGLGCLALAALLAGGLLRRHASLGAEPARGGDAP